MTAFALCVLALVLTYFAGRRSLGMGLVVLLAFGYFYGIVRANVLTVFSHFIFDAGLLGLYLSQGWNSSDPFERTRIKTLQVWTAILIIWPCLVVLLPFQPLLISLVGLRGNILFLPVLLLGSKLKDRDLVQFATGLAVLNIVAVAFATAEYNLGVTRFYPLSPVTPIIYASNDVAGGFHRIPAIFTAAHAYGGTMVTTLPFLFGLWSRTSALALRTLALVGAGAALLGVLMSATRQNFLYALILVVITLLTARLSSRSRGVLLALMLLVAIAAVTNARFQRFKSLLNSEDIENRLAGSVNRGFFEILSEHPMGNGLGGGGTSIPYFLLGQVKNPIGMENVYAQILAEQGVIGFMLWLAFLAWFFTRAPGAFTRHQWSTSRKLAWCLAAMLFATAWIGLGLLTSIPGTVILLLGMGWSSVPPAAEDAQFNQSLQQSPLFRANEYAFPQG
jgi:hypothetical protein